MSELIVPDAILRYETFTGVFPHPHLERPLIEDATYLFPNQKDST